MSFSWCQLFSLTECLLWWFISVSVINCLPRVQINSSVPILKKKKKNRGGAELSSLSVFFPLWTCQQRALKRPCRRKELLSQLQLQGGFQVPPRFVQGWLKRKMECKIPDIQFMHKQPRIPLLISNYTWFQYCGGLATECGDEKGIERFFFSPLCYFRRKNTTVPQNKYLSPLLRS